jgi:hypothetical protein
MYKYIYLHIYTNMQDVFIYGNDRRSLERSHALEQTLGVFHAHRNIDAHVPSERLFPYMLSERMSGFAFDKCVFSMQVCMHVSMYVCMYVSVYAIREDEQFCV